MPVVSRGVSVNTEPCTYKNLKIGLSSIDEILQHLGLTVVASGVDRVPATELVTLFDHLSDDIAVSRSSLDSTLEQPKGPPKNLLPNQRQPS